MTALLWASDSTGGGLPSESVHICSAHGIELISLGFCGVLARPPVGLMTAPSVCQRTNEVSLSDCGGALACLYFAHWLGVFKCSHLQEHGCQLERGHLKNEWPRFVVLGRHALPLSYSLYFAPKAV